MADLTTTAINIIVQIIILAPVLWLVGGKIAKKEDVKFLDAIWIVVLGAVVSGILGYFNLGLIGAVVGFILWLLLIKHFFDTTWLKSFIISIVTTIVLLIIAAILGLIGLGALMLL